MKRLHRLLTIIFVGMGLVMGLVEPVYAKNTFAVWDQTHFRFRNDDGSETAATWKAAEDTNITGQIKEENFRLRLQTSETATQDQGETVAPRLEYKAASGGACTDTTGWTVVTTSTTNAFALTTSANFTDGAATTSQLTLGGGYAFIAGEILDATNLATAVSGLSKDLTEHEWNMQATTNAGDSTAYIFRVSNNATDYNAYAVCPQVTTSAPLVPTFTLNAYRWYVDPSPESENATDPWGNPDIAQNTAITVTPSGNDPPDSTQELRLRTNFTVNTTNLPATDTAFKLQYKTGTDATCTTGIWADLGVSEAWNYATSTVTDGTDLTVSRISPVSDVLEEYIKSSPTGTNPNSATTGQEVEYDFHIVGGSAFATATQYSFRVIESDATIFDDYTNCPTLSTEPGMVDLMRHGASLNAGVEHGFWWVD